MLPRSLATLVWAAAVLAVATLIGLTCWALIAARQPDQPAHSAYSGDLAALRDLAAETRPIVAALERFRQQNGRYPLRSGELAEHWPAGVLADDIGDTISLDLGNRRIWLYARDPDEQGYQLTLALPEGGNLARVVTANGAVWRHTADEVEEPEDLPLDPS